MGCSLEWVKQRYDLPFLKRGMRVQTFDGSYGNVTSAAQYGRIHVRLDGQKRPDIYHPTWEMKYIDKTGKILADFQHNDEKENEHDWLSKRKANTCLWVGLQQNTVAQLLPLRKS